MSNDTWATPLKIFKYYDAKFNFMLDVCAEDSTAKCKYFLTKENDALSFDWDSLMVKGEYIWCNPPYSNIAPWVKKAIDCAKGGVGVVMLVMCDPSVKWFSLALEYCTEIQFITNGRISFESDGVPQNGNNKGSCIFIFSPNMLSLRKTTYLDRELLLNDPL